LNLARSGDARSGAYKLRAARRGAGLVKTAVDLKGDRLLAREARWLRELEAVDELEGQVPRLVDEGLTPEGRRYLVLDVAALDAERGETRTFTRAHARFLALLGKARFRATDFEVSGCSRSLQRGLQSLEGRADPRSMALLEQAYHDCETALLYWTGPYVLAQGDFTPSNARSLGARVFVVEWGRARAEASPLEDVLHFLLAGRVRRLPEAMQRAEQFARRAWPEWPWRPQVIGALTLVYLIGALLERALAGGRLEHGDALTGAYWKHIETRSAWMPA
jgi:hypothetical protein